MTASNLASAGAAARMSKVDPNAERIARVAPNAVRAKDEKVDPNAVKAKKVEDARRAPWAE
jgi:hypothetical protein